MQRAPNTYSPEEVRRAIQKMLATSDTQGLAIADTRDDLMDVDARLDVLEAGNDPQAEAAEDISAGMPLYILNGLVRVGLASAGSVAMSRVIGLARTSALAGVAVAFAVGGKIELQDWTAAAGIADLTPSATYYLGDGGGITTTAPTTNGLFVTEIGQAINTSVLSLCIKRPIRL